MKKDNNHTDIHSSCNYRRSDLGIYVTLTTWSQSYTHKQHTHTHTHTHTQTAGIGHALQIWSGSTFRLDATVCPVTVIMAEQIVG